MESHYQHLKLEIFDKIINGSLRPDEAIKRKANELKKITRVVNTATIRVAENLSNKDIVDRICLSKYGFKGHKDFKLIVEKSEKFVLVSLIPKINYRCDDDIDLPCPPDNICKVYREILEDAYVRATIKAYSIQDSDLREGTIRLLITKTHEKAKFLYTKSLNYLKRIQDNGTDLHEFYVILSASLFLMKFILFLQKTSKTYINGKTLTEDKVKYLMYKSLKLNKIFEWSMCVFQAKYDRSNKLDSGKRKKNKWGRWNDQINKLVAFFFDRREEKTKDGLPQLEMDDESIVEMLTNYIRDKEDIPLSPHTVRTYLRKDKPDKRPKGRNRLQFD